MHRLRGAGAFEALFRSGRRFEGRFLELVAAPAARPPGRVGYVISRRSMPHAVDRNRLRRKLRESVRAARPGIAAYDIIVRVKRALPAHDIDRATSEGDLLIRRLAHGETA